MDFELILSIAVLVTFLAWFLYKIGMKGSVIEYLQSLFGVLLLVLFIRSFLYEPFRIPSSSMRPTLVIGDFVAVNKFIYGLRLPVFGTKIFDIGDPERGDIMVFKYPPEPSINYIKRVIGIPGDKIALKNLNLYVNGILVSTENNGSRAWTDSECTKYKSNIMIEKLPNKTHNIMHTPGQHRLGDVDIIVPEGKYFMMGDNRDHSSDSRYWGLVPKENIVGKAQAIFMNIDWSGDCAKGVQLNRIGGIESNN